jgi:hypothetical protein
MQPLRIQAKWLSSEPSLGPLAVSSPNIATLAEPFAEARGDEKGLGSTEGEPGIAATTERLVRPKVAGNGAAQSPASKPAAAPVATKKSGRAVKGLVAALTSVAFVLTAILFVVLWQDTMGPRGGNGVAPAEVTTTISLPDSTGSAQRDQASSSLEVALSSSERIEAKAGERIAFPVVIDATEALPAQSIVAITALPDGASFSSGRPYGDTGWSLSPDEIGDLWLQLPAQSGASHMRLELVAGDGTVLAQSETQMSITAPLPQVATDAAVTSALPEEPAKIALAEPAADLPPKRKPASRVANEAAVKVNTVKVVTIEPPRQKRPHDGAYALGSPADAAASGEWMETKTAVDMHAKAQQSSETVKVAEKGIKMRVTARDKNWIQVNDPASSAIGWIYNRFLKPTDPPAR